MEVRHQSLEDVLQARVLAARVDHVDILRDIFDREVFQRWDVDLGGVHDGYRDAVLQTVRLMFSVQLWSFSGIHIVETKGERFLEIHIACLLATTKLPEKRKRGERVIRSGCYCKCGNNSAFTFTAAQNIDRFLVRYSWCYEAITTHEIKYIQS
jgi:hypothetical protein